jgi:Ca2+-binding RTX toxin-like protein
MSDDLLRSRLSLDAGPLATTVSADLGRLLPPTQVRLTFTSSEVGNGSSRDSDTMANQDGGLAVRAQLETARGALVGPVVRYSDEGVTFDGKGFVTFDVRDVVSGVQRGDQFDVVELGTKGADRFDESGSREAYYINAGMGDDHVTGGRGRDFLVGGAGHDTLDGREGNDSFIGGGGDDRILGGSGDDLAIVNLATDGSDQIDLGSGRDKVSVSAPAMAPQVLVTFTSSEVGNDQALDSDTMANQDGGLAVRLQAEDGSGTLVGAVGRFDDEGVTFESNGAFTFDVRDLVSGVQRGDAFDALTLGTKGNDTINLGKTTTAQYVNAGMGDDRVTGGRGKDFLVGGAGNDRIAGREGDDSLLGGAGQDTFIFSGRPGTDTVIDFVAGADRLDLRAYDLDFGDVRITRFGADTLVGVNTDRDSASEFQFKLAGVSSVSESDFLLG